MVGLLCRLTKLRRRRSPIDVVPAVVPHRPSMFLVGRTGAACEPAPALSAMSGDRRARSMQREPSFSTVQVAPDFSPAEYADTFAALQVPTSSKVLDLVPARLLCADIFERLAGAWTAASAAVPQLGIVLSFERWVMLRDTALAALQPLIARGIRVQVFYAEQASAGYLTEWFARGWVVHDVRAAIATLATGWCPSPSWPCHRGTARRVRSRPDRLAAGALARGSGD